MVRAAAAVPVAAGVAHKLLALMEREPDYRYFNVKIRLEGF